MEYKFRETLKELVNQPYLLSGEKNDIITELYEVYDKAKKYNKNQEPPTPENTPEFKKALDKSQAFDECKEQLETAIDRHIGLMSEGMSTADREKALMLISGFNQSLMMMENKEEELK